MNADPAALLCAWQDHPANPLIEPPEGQFLLGDPAVVEPGDAPDGKWHLFANGLLGLYHYVSADGVAWEEVDNFFGIGTVRPFIYLEGGTYYLLFEQFTALGVSEIQLTASHDLHAWSEPTTVLRPELDWEKESQTTVGNPFLLFRDGQYWLYYSAAGVYLEDAKYTEPRYIGLARAPAIGGPYVKMSQPIIAPDAGVAWRNLGAGSLKLLDDRYAGR